MIYIQTRYCWKPCPQERRSFSQVSSIKTFDFSTLYTTLPHDKLKTRLKETIHKAFSHRNYGSKFAQLLALSTLIRAIIHALNLMVLRNLWLWVPPCHSCQLFMLSSPTYESKCNGDDDKLLIFEELRYFNVLIYNLFLKAVSETYIKNNIVFNKHIFVVILEALAFCLTFL
jgi:hypothetical protein